MQKVLLRFLLTLIICFPQYLFSQNKTIQGEVLDKQSDEPIPFASVKFTVQGGGMLTDSLGKFLITLNNTNDSDTVLISSVGYTHVKIPVSYLKDSSFITVQLTVTPPQHDVVVKTK